MTATEAKCEMWREPRLRYYAALAAGLELEETKAIPRAGIDGTTIYINPDWHATLSPKQAWFVQCHQVCHPLLGHCMRRDGRDKSMWNVACDAAVAGVLKELIDGGMIAPPDNAITPDTLEMGWGIDAEYYYKEPSSNTVRAGADPLRYGEAGDRTSGKAEGLGDLPSDNGRDGGRDAGSAGASDFGGCGLDVRDAANPSRATVEWLERMIAAVVQSDCVGSTPGYAHELIVALKRKVTFNWRQALRRFASDLMHQTPTFCRPNRRHLHRGLVLPGRPRRRELRTLHVYIDTSGSHGSSQIASAIGELNVIAAQYRNLDLVVGQFDTRLHTVKTYTSRDLPIREIRIHGRGGTRVGPVFDYLSTLRGDDRPNGIIIITDGKINDYPTGPQRDRVLWLFTQTPTKARPTFGTQVEIVI